MERANVNRTPATTASGRRSSDKHPATAAADQNARWHDLVCQIGAEVASPLTAALERIQALGSSGRIDPLSLRSLREEVAQARLAGMIGQQLTRLASGRLRQSHERMKLADVLSGVINHRHRETRARGISLDPAHAPAMVNADASLLFSLLNTCLDWALANAHSQIQFAIDAMPAHACLVCLVCQFDHRPTGSVRGDSRPDTPTTLNALSWRLLEQTAWTMGLTLQREGNSSGSTLTLTFPGTAGAKVAALGTNDLDQGFAPSANSKPLAGNHVLVVSSRRDLRAQVHESLQHMGLIVDYVHSAEQAVDFCREGLPHAIVIETPLNSDRFGALRDEINAEVPGFVFIEIIEGHQDFESPGLGGDCMARVGRDAIAQSLSAALMFELTRGMQADSATR